MITKTMPSETVEAGRIAELVEQIERACREVNHWMAVMDRSPIGSPMYRTATNICDALDNGTNQARAELRAILGVDPYRLANAIGA